MVLDESAYEYVCLQAFSFLAVKSLLRIVSSISWRRCSILAIIRSSICSNSVLVTKVVVDSDETCAATLGSEDVVVTGKAGWDAEIEGVGAHKSGGFGDVMGEGDKGLSTEGAVKEEDKAR